MPNPVFPTLSQGQDSKQFSMVQEDPTLSSPVEGGYVITRARHTRTPRKTFTSGFTGIGAADKALLEAFLNTVRVGSVIFDWTNPEDSAVYQVRFTKPVTFRYVGIRDTRLWDVQFEVQTA